MVPGKFRLGMGLGIGMLNIIPLSNSVVPVPPPQPNDVVVSTLQALSGALCMRVRRNSDDAEMDIAYAGGKRDDATLATFCTGTDGYVVRWYGIGGSQDLIQLNAAVQPMCCIAGVPVVDDNGSPGVFFDPALAGAAMSLESENVVPDGSARFALIVAQRTTPAGNPPGTGTDEWYGSSNGQHWHELECKSSGGFRRFDMECAGVGRQEWNTGANQWTQNVPLCHGVNTPGSGNGPYSAYLNGVEQAPSNSPTGSSWGSNRRIRLGSGQFTTVGAGANMIATEFIFAVGDPASDMGALTLARGQAHGQ